MVLNLELAGLPVDLLATAIKQAQLGALLAW